MMTSSTAKDSVRRTVRRLGTGSMECLARIAWAVGPVNGGSPASVSYNTQPNA